jgi:dihydrofolate reductase
MSAKRKIIVYIATSADGYIARPDGDVEWLNRRPRTIDYEFDIHVIPVFIGEGIPLVAPRHRDVPLRLRSSRKYPDGVVRLRYEVAR